VIHKYDKIRI